MSQEISKFSKFSELSKYNKKIINKLNNLLIENHYKLKDLIYFCVKYYFIISENINAVPDSGNTLLHVVAIFGNSDKVRYFCGKFDLSHLSSFQNNNGDTALHIGVRNGDIEIVKYFFRKIDLSSSVNLKDSLGMTPLHWAVLNGNLEMVELLIK